VRMLGYHAIDMYSMKPIEPGELDEFLSNRSSRDLGRAIATEQLQVREPLRVLVVGQAKAGRSSVINALVGEPQAPVDVVPRTRGTDVYRGEGARLPSGVFLFHDTAGYGAQEPASDAFATLRPEILACDILLLVVSARSASRAADRQFLDQVRTLFQRETERRLPVLITVLTHADAIRPIGEWDPPYDLARAETPKAVNLRDAIRAVSQDLALAPDQPVIPISLRSDHLDRIDELSAAIWAVLPDARGAQRSRCLPEYRRADSLRRLWPQVKGGGRLLLGSVQRWLQKRPGR
jgi:uncharacterized protein